MGCGIIKYSFYRETSPVEILVPEKDKNQSSTGNAAGAVATVVATGVAVCFVGFVGYGGLIAPCKEMKTLTAVAY